ncbi:succinyl-diaminopimelate desuccinylase [Rhodothalassium salexigens]|uniref:succinyl-diaminopimelate desuccinylase n=1 Tax=Rhodothalassium salexigens TaxID=1086 RepID=UPI0019149639|nr:succinyl-diaminopimelate desuccinylase [Rhodothalassium salexigens]MBK5911378.1 succinyl-diaminopimelate desuccinylase [Rhodothalassium salexigens]MBK5920205.1 succinyl-diaminopimelate desuccinylase [Rhodothalassium salexigens]
MTGPTFSTAHPLPPLADPRGVLDPVTLARALIRCPSVTPRDEGALDLVQTTLEALGFRCWRLPFASPGTARVDNLFARWDSPAGPGRHLCFAGHTDVVPAGQATRWSVDPFAADLTDDGRLIGRGAADMKGAIAAFAAAVSRHLTDGEGAARPGSLSFLITGDEEGPAVNGTVRVLQWMAETGNVPDLCLVGEPTNPGRLGEMIKIGRRGSLNGRLVVHGAQGHVAYPHLADNAATKAMRLLMPLAEAHLDDGTAHFQPSSLAVTSIDIANPAHNVIPGEAEALFNIRFNDAHTGDGLKAWIAETLAATGVPATDYELDLTVTGEAFVTPPGPLSDALVAAIGARLGVEPTLSTSGGTSDARFIKDHCPVAEFGLVGATMHKADEQVPVADIAALSDIYTDVIARLLA